MDILGFADLVESSDIQAVIHLLEVTLRMFPLVKSLGALPDGIEKRQFNITAKDQKLSIFSFSDTFVLASSDDSISSFFQIIAGTAIFSSYLFAAKLPVRGAITCGEADYITGTSHMVGRAIIRAARLEKLQDWFGVIIDPSVLNKENLAILQFPLLRPLVIDYEVPLKDNKILSNPCKVINWRFNMNVESGISSLFREGTEPDHKIKKEQTLKFCSWLRKTERAYGTIYNSKGEKVSVPWLTGVDVGHTPPNRPEFKHGDEY